MRLIADAGLWRTDTTAEGPPLTVVLEISGAVLEWTIDSPDDAPVITFTDPERADWLWRLVGRGGHVQMLTAIGDPAGPGPVDLPGIGIDAVTAAMLRRLALGHWLRRWWPASPRDGIPALDPALLAAELAVLTVAAEQFFTDDTFDSGIEELLAPYTGRLGAGGGDSDPRIRDLAGAALELAESHGIAVSAPVEAGLGVRADYALAAGTGREAGSTAVARGTDTVQWSAVPAAVFDAAENTVTWRIEADEQSVRAEIAVVVLQRGPSAGIPVLLSAQGATAAGVLDERGVARLRVVGPDDRPLTETSAWNIRWSDATVRIGAALEDPAGARQRVRALARARLDGPGADAFLVERLAAESLY